MEKPKSREFRDQHWTEYAVKHLEGRTIKSVRYLSTAEMSCLGWTRRTLVLELDDGTLLFPSMDDEGNEAGVLFGQRGNESLLFPAL